MKRFQSQLSKIRHQLTPTESFLVIFCLISIILRIYLVFYLPAWQDEIYTLRAIGAPLKDIFIGMIDPVHPPGYYVLLKILSIFNNYIFTIRLISVIGFTLNLLLLYRIGKIYSKNLSTNLVLTYSLSTYFITFDWQARMYTLSTTLILLSLYTLYANSKKTSNLPPWFFIINTFGLFFDFAFFWYFIPLTILSFINKIPIIIPRNNKSLIIQNIQSWMLFFLVFPNLFYNIPFGIRGISWSGYYLEPKYFIPIFTGSMTVHMLSILSLILVFIGIYYGLKKKNLSKITSLLINISLISGIGTMLISKMINTPVFHVRSLQIIGITIIWLYAVALTKLKKMSGYLYYLIVFTLFICFLTQVIISPGTYF